MSNLKSIDKRKLERLFQMERGGVLNFRNRTLAGFFEDYEIDIEDKKYYGGNSGSKANRLREFWKLEDDYIVYEVTKGLIDYACNEYSLKDEIDQELVEKCYEICNSLIGGDVDTSHLKDLETGEHINQQIKRLKSSIHNDSELALGTSKELIEAICKKILSEQNIEIEEDIDMPQLTKKTLSVLDLVPENISNEKKGHQDIKTILGSLGSIIRSINNLRNIYGTGHGKNNFKGLEKHHAKLIAGSTVTLATFLLETHNMKRK